MRHIAVIDFGKTNAKLLVVDLATGAETAVARTRNAVRREGPYPHHDAEALWQFVLGALVELERARPIDAISITTHGAAAALVDASGALALPLLDYEHDGPEALRADYDAARPAFAETGSPRLPMGLNLGAQIHWQARAFPDAFARTCHILTLPQYWAFRLTGVAASEATSLGCHTDLWNPAAGSFSALVERMGWRPLLPPLRRAGDILGPILPDIAARTGLPADTPVLCGIHDSNASLVPWLAERGPRAILSTGTWMIVMALGGRPVALDPARDTLINVNAMGDPVPTARFMAGREFEEIAGDNPVPASDEDEGVILARGDMALPARHADTGPFPGQRFTWTAEPRGGERTAAASFYVALMGAACLGLVGAQGPSVVEGPLARNHAFARMLAAATGRPVILAGRGAGTGLGAALLAGPLLSPPTGQVTIEPPADPRWRAYAEGWRAAVRARDPQAM